MSQNQFLSFCIFFLCQDAQQERSTFVSSLLPLLAEYSLQPPVADAQSIVSNVKVSFDMFPLKLSDAATLVQALTSIIYKYDMYLSVSFSCHREEKPLKLYYVEIRLMKGSQFYS